MTYCNPPPGEPRTRELIEAEFPGWAISRATSGLWHAQNTVPSGFTVSGDDLPDLRDQMRAATRRAEHAAGSG